MSSRPQVLIAFIVAALAWPCSAWAGDIGVVGGIPAGFEQLNAPRPTAVTVSYGGDVLGVFKAHFTPDTVQFDAPDEVVKTIPNLTQEEVVQQVLRQALPSNAGRLCTAKRSTNCGMLKPDVIGLIFDETHLSAEIFINKNYLTVSLNNGERYLPLPKRQMASIYSFSGAATGTDSQGPNFAVTNETIHSYGEMKLTTETTEANQGLRFDAVAGSVDRNGWDATGGLFRSRALQLVSDHDMAGVSVATSRKTVLDNYKSEGSNIILYLPRRSFVSIYREGRLYSSQAYEAGNQQINTSELPEGAYPITLRIQEADGAIREERRFFVKSEEIPPPGQPVYYAQAGVIRKDAAQDSTLPQLTSDLLIRTGTVRRINDNIGLDLGVMGIRDRVLLETGTFMLLNDTRINTAVLTSTKGDFGVQASYQKTMDRLSLATDARKLWMSDTPIEEFDMRGDLLQGTAVASYLVTQNVSFGMRGSYAQQDDTPTTTSFGPYAEWRIWQRGENLLALNADIAHSQGQNQGDILLSFTKRFGKYGSSTTVGAGVGGDSRGPVGNTRIWHDNETPGNNVIFGGGVSADERHQIVNGDADWRNNFGQFRGNVQEAVGDGQETFGYGGNFAFNAAQMADEFHVGGDQSDKSAVIIDTHGDTERKMTILINDVPRGTVTIGQKQVVYLSPYHIYRIRLAPEHPSLLDYDSAERKVTVYAGNVVKLSWDINTFYVVTAHIAALDGKPLANAVLQESRSQTATNEKGYLQAELPMTKSLHFTAADKTTCQVDLPEYIEPINGVLIYKGVLPCHAVATGQL